MSRLITRAAFILGILIGLTLSSGAAAWDNMPSERLYTGWLRMYDLQFDAAHRLFQEWEVTHPRDPMARSSDAAAYLFAELTRMGILESSLFVDDRRFSHRQRLRPDPKVKAMFEDDLERAERSADSVLQSSGSDRRALLAKCLNAGLKADYAALIQKENLNALAYTKQARGYAEKLLAINPAAYDAHLAPGIENYLLSLKPMLIRLGLRLTGSRVDQEEGLRELQITASHGFYLEPFAKLLLALAALRDHDRKQAGRFLQELHERFPHNELYARELAQVQAQR